MALTESPRGAGAVRDPTVSGRVRIACIGSDRQEPLLYGVLQNKGVGAIGCGTGRGLHGASEIETEIEPAELIEDCLALAHQLQIVADVWQFVLPVPDVVGAEGHLFGIEPVCEAH